MIKNLIRVFYSFLKKILAATIATASIGAASVTTATITEPTTSGKFNASNYYKSISAEAFCNLSAEVSQGEFQELFLNNMDLVNNQVSGWIYIQEETFENDFSYSLWVNKYEPTTYCIAFAGTDSIKDALEYIPMETAEDRSPQMQTAAQITKESIKTIAELNSKNQDSYGFLKTLYICGHSLGGYLAMYITSDIIDSSLGYKNNIITIDDIGFDSYEQVKKDLRCVTFGAPGMHYEGEPLGIKMTEWQKQKVEIDKEKKYNNIITQYVNSKDPVANLFPSYLKHIGTLKYYNVNNLNLAARIKFVQSNKSILGLGAGFSPIFYHGPWLYINLIK